MPFTPTLCLTTLISLLLQFRFLFLSLCLPTYLPTYLLPQLSNLSRVILCMSPRQKWLYSHAQIRFSVQTQLQTSYFSQVFPATCAPDNDQINI